MPYRTEIKTLKKRKRETMKNNIKVILWNARSLLPKHHLFQWYMLEHEVDIAFITETWLQARGICQYMDMLQKEWTGPMDMVELRYI
jgi:hypothetical protein